MEQQILVNTETIINNFNELLIKTINIEKDKLIEDFKAQIKSDVVQKLNGNNDELYTNNFKLDDILNEMIGTLSDHGDDRIVKNNFKEINLILKPDEKIINYKYQLINVNGQSNYFVKHAFLLILTNYGTLLIKRHYSSQNIYYGKYKLPNEILYILNEYINILLGNNYKTQYGYTYDNNSREYKDSILTSIYSITKIIEKIQIDYYAKPLIGYHAQQLIDENTKLKEENEKAKILYDKIQKEKADIKQLQNKLDNDMNKYNNVKDMEKKWNEIKDYKMKLDILSDKIKADREDFEKQKKKFEKEKQDFNKSKIEIDIKNSKLNDDFLNFVNDKINDNMITENQTIMTVNNTNSNSLYEKIKQNPLILKDIDDSNKTESLCIMAVEENIYALEYVPKNMLNDIFRYLIKEHHNNIFDNIPEHLLTQELCNIAVDINVNNIREIPKKFRTEELCNIVMAQYDDYELEDDDGFLISVPNKYKTKEMCEKFVQLNGLELQGVPEVWRSKELCELAIKNNGHALGYVPDNLKTIENIILAVVYDGWNYSFVPSHIKYDLIKYLIDNNMNNIIYKLHTYSIHDTVNLIVLVATEHIKYIIESTSLYKDIDIDKSTRAIKSLLWQKIVTKSPKNSPIDTAIELFKQSIIENIKQFTNNDIMNMINILDEHDKKKKNDFNM